MMKRLRITRDVVVLVLLFVLIIGLSAYVALRRGQAERAAAGASVPFSSHSSQDGGTLALYEWLNAIGYRAQRIENQAFRVGDEVRLLLIISPSEEISRDEALYLLNWVERGHTLYVADDGFGSGNGIFEQLGVTLEGRNNRRIEVQLTQPLVNQTVRTLNGLTFSTLESKRNDFVEFGRGAGSVLLRIAHGRGSVWLTSAPELLSNASLQNESNAKFALGLVGNLPRGGVIAFDEYHHGLNDGGEQTFLFATYNSPWGWSLILALVILFGYLVINGKRFGRTIPVQRTLARRTPSEYVVSMANLFRRANQRGMVLQHYRHSLKRRLGRPFHLDPDLADERYVEMLTRMRPELDRTELVNVLNHLRRAEANEMDLVKSVEQAVTLARPKPPFKR